MHRLVNFLFALPLSQVLACDDPARGFPATFLFGTSTSGFESDMGCPTLSPTLCTDSNSDWYRFATSPETIEARGTYLSGEDPAVVGPGAWELYEEDLDRLQLDLGANGFRISIEWSRIFPAPTDEIEGFEALRAASNPQAVEHYHNLLSAMRVRGITPLVTLSAYTLPVWIHDAVDCHFHLSTCKGRGWLDAERTIREIVKFASFAGVEFGAQVDLWIAVHNPVTIFFSGYLIPSEMKSQAPAVWLKVRESKEIYLALVEANARIYDTLKESDIQDADGDGVVAAVGFTLPISPALPANPKSQKDLTSAANMDLLWNTLWLDSLILGKIDEDMDGVGEIREELAGRADFIGINYLIATVVTGTQDPIFPAVSVLTTFDPFSLKAQEHAEGLYQWLLRLHRSYSLPLYVTEIGTDDRNDNGSAPGYLVRHLDAVQRALQDGADVRAFLVSTLVDGFEYNHGTQYRYGLYAVDTDDPAKPRSPRQGVATFADVIRRREVTAELLGRYPPEPSE